MLNVRTHTYYFKNIENDHPLKNLYKNASNLTFNDIIKFYNWKIEQNYYKNNLTTRTHIVFD